MDQTKMLRYAFNAVDPALTTSDEAADGYDAPIRALLESGADLTNFDALKQELRRTFAEHFAGVEVGADKLDALADKIVTLQP